MDTGVSDHYMVYVTRKELGTQYNGHKMRKVRTFTSGNEDQLQYDKCSSKYYFHVCGIARGYQNVTTYVPSVLEI